MWGNREKKGKGARVSSTDVADVAALTFDGFRDFAQFDHAHHFDQSKQPQGFDQADGTQLRSYFVLVVGRRHDFVKGDSGQKVDQKPST